MVIGRFDCAAHSLMAASGFQICIIITFTADNLRAAKLNQLGIADQQFLQLLIVLPDEASENC